MLGTSGIELLYGPVPAIIMSMTVPILLYLIVVLYMWYSKR